MLSGCSDGFCSAQMGCFAHAANLSKAHHLIPYPPPTVLRSFLPTPDELHSCPFPFERPKVKQRVKFLVQSESHSYARRRRLRWRPPRRL